MINANEIFNYMRIHSTRMFSTDDIARQFDITYRAAYRALGELTVRGKVARINNAGFYTYQYIDPNDF